MEREPKLERVREPEPVTPEAYISDLIRERAPELGLVLFRNNSGAFADAKGRLVRFGLGNDSPAICRKRKSSDLIGAWAPYGVFVAIEVKRAGWVFKGTPREVAQLNFINEINASGGIALFASSWSDVYNKIVAQMEKVA